MQTLQSVDRALAIPILLQQEGTMSLTEIARRIEVPTSTTRRLLMELIDEGFVERTGSRSYVAGHYLRDMVVSRASYGELLRVADPVMERLAVSCRATTHLHVAVDPFLRVLRSISDKRHFAAENLQGLQLDMASTAPGEAILSFADNGRLERALNDPRVPQVNRSQLRRNLDEARLQGLVMRSPKHNVIELAVPIRDTSGQCFGAISLQRTGVHSDDPTPEAAGRILMRSKQEIEAQLAESVWVFRDEPGFPSEATTKTTSETETQ
ncbi:IclR family transcriptional regulator [Arthrobacter sulfonylureivorans]|uniref:Helix-turn-helix domain-containing protein n=1 Tax=Arthrobacter sulfonylureivorans TaxID=2486855 RepID=A0ABY3WBN9_9MICC|nr:helix-turn-helix domain-containing protein [Arthrobacter sulfonylureivorans]UNK47772.1 helix-turn-helix domain-containing protein [Arthrobacter sulfonylureivorans]